MSNMGIMLKNHKTIRFLHWALNAFDPVTGSYTLLEDGCLLGQHGPPKGQ